MKGGVCLFGDGFEGGGGVLEGGDDGVGGKLGCSWLDVIDFACEVDGFSGDAEFGCDFCGGLALCYVVGHEFSVDGDFLAVVVEWDVYGEFFAAIFDVLFGDVVVFGYSLNGFALLDVFGYLFSDDS